MAPKEDKKADGAKGDKKKEEPKEAPKPLTPQEVLFRNLFLLDKFAETRDVRFLSRVLRYTQFLRVHLPTAQLRVAVDTYVADPARRAVVQGLVSAAAERRKEPTPVKAAASDSAAAAAPAPAGTGAGSSAMEVEGEGGASSSSAAAAKPAAAAAASSSSAAAAAAPAVKPPKPSLASAPEVEAYLALLPLSMLQAARAWAPLADGVSAYLRWLGGFNRRTLDFFGARGHAMAVLAAEHAPSGGAAASSPDALLPGLLAAHRTSTLRHDDYGTAVALNLALRTHIRAGAYDAASKLLAKAPFPEAASPAQLCRYLYYRGRVQAVTLDYSDAHASLTQAVRKAPPGALGFRLSATKFGLVAQLLTGEVPDRALFAAPDMAAPLAPYLAVTRAVRLGDLPAFTAALAAHRGDFERDGTLSLVGRLETVVIKTGLVSLSVAYSRIPFTAVAAKLGLGSPEDAEFLCAKAIRDGVVDAVLDHEGRCLASREVTDVYATREPQSALHRRIGFCLDVHNEAVRGLRYPPGAHRGDLESAEARREREREEEELAKEIEEGHLDDEDDDGME